MNGLINLAERGYLPDSLLRYGMRRLIGERIQLNHTGTVEARHDQKMMLIESLKTSPVALHTDKANQQHYELPASFFELVLGKYRKYSSCYFENGTTDLDKAENDMLNLTCERAQLHDGMDILELGCGWGSLTLWMAEHYPNSHIVAVSNSSSQKAYIEEKCKQNKIENVSVITSDANDFHIDVQFDRVVTVEMFEHMRNYDVLMKRITTWLNSNGKLFVHIFTHQHYPYFFETDGAKNWMGRYFFTGGIMPSDDLLLHFQDRLNLEAHWVLDGTHYQKTSNLWLKNMDRNRAEILDIFESVYGAQHKLIWFNRWRMFFMACAELFGYNNGNEWLVSHYRFSKQ